MFRRDPISPSLAKLGVDIHEAANGVGLSKDFHRSMHTKEYYDLVNQQSRNWKTKQQAEAGLQKIAEQLKAATERDRAREMMRFNDTRLPY